MLPSDQRRMMEQAKFSYSPLRKALEKKTKTFEDQSKIQITAIEDHGKQLVEFNALIKKVFNNDNIVFKKQKKYLMKLLRKGLLNFRI